MYFHTIGIAKHMNCLALIAIYATLKKLKAREEDFY